MKPNTWITIAIISLPLITTPLISILPDFSFSPRGVIYSDHALAFFLSPLAPPRNPLELISRAAQCILLYRLPVDLLVQCVLHIALATVRTILNYALTRSVGWAYPALFSPTERKPLSKEEPDICDAPRRRAGRGGPASCISSRIVLDHIGGMATTIEGKALNSDKWRCGWRHPFHGDDRVNVVVV